MKNQNSQLTEKELLAIFPEAKSFIRWKIKELQREQVIIIRCIRDKLKVVRNKSAPPNQWFWILWVKVNEGQDLLKIKKQLSHFKWIISSPKTNLGSERITEEMKQRALHIPVENILNVKLKRTGKNLMGLCPFHMEKRSSFCIFPDNRYKCFGCGEYGNSISAAMKIHNLNFKQAVKYLLNK